MPSHYQRAFECCCPVLTCISRIDWVSLLNRPGGGGEARVRLVSRGERLHDDTQDAAISGVQDAHLLPRQQRVP